MDIVKKQSETVPVNSLHYGQVFEAKGGKHYMVIPAICDLIPKGGEVFVVNLTDNLLTFFSKDAEVTPVEHKLIIG